MTGSAVSASLAASSTEAQLKKALKACQKEKAKSQRKACEQKAQKRYGGTNGAPKNTEPTHHETPPGEEERVEPPQLAVVCPETTSRGTELLINVRGPAGATITVAVVTPTAPSTKTVVTNSAGVTSF